MADLYQCILKHTQDGSEIRKLIQEELKTFAELKEKGQFKGIREEKYLTDKIKKLTDNEKKTILSNDEAFRKQEAYIKEISKERGAKGTEVLLDLIKTNNRWHKGARQNLSKKIEAEQNASLGKAFIELDKIQHFKENLDIDIAKPEGKKLNDDITRERARLNGAEIQETGNKVALQYAKALNKVSDDAINKLQVYGFDINKREGYGGSQTHNKKLLNETGFDSWFSFVSKEGDLKKAPFLSDKIVMRKIYDKLSNGDTLDLLDLPLSLKESIDDFKITRSIAFKDIEAEIRYREQFGQKNNQVQSTLNQLNRFASDIIVRQEFGANADGVIQKLYNSFSAEKGADKIKLSKIQTIFNEVQGKSEVEHEGVAIAGRNIRSLISSSIYGAVAYTTPISDRMLMALKSWQRNGGLGQLMVDLPFSIATGLKDTGEYIIKGISPSRKGGLTPAQKNFALEQGLATQSMISAIGRYFEDINTLGAGQGISKIVDGINKTFSKISFLEAKQNIDDLRDFTLYAKELYKDLQKGNWNNLSKQRKGFLEANGFTKQEYDILKQIKIDENTTLREKVFTGNNVKDLTNKQLEPLIQDRLNKNPSLTKNDNLYNLVRYELENKVRTMFTAESFAQRGYKDERANILTRGTKAGTFSGELTRFMTQGKSFPFLFWDNVITSLYTQVSATKGEKIGAFVAFAGVSILGGYVVEQLNEIRNGKQPKELDKEMMVRSLIRSGVLGIYGDLANASLSQAFDISKTTGYQTKANLYKELLGLLGPSISKSGDLLEGINNLMAQNPDPDKLIKSIKSNIPGNNIFYVSGMINYLTLELSQVLGGKGIQKNEKLMRQQKNAFGERRENLF